MIPLGLPPPLPAVVPIYTMGYRDSVTRQLSVVSAPGSLSQFQESLLGFQWLLGLRMGRSGAGSSEMLRQGR